jgi:hypothetical protein
MTPDERAKKVETAMRLAWSSLESHLQYTHGRHPDGKLHHKKCVKEYCELLRLLSELY